MARSTQNVETREDRRNLITGRFVSGLAYVTSITTCLLYKYAGVWFAWSFSTLWLAVFLLSWLYLRGFEHASRVPEGARNPFAGDR